MKHLEEKLESKEDEIKLLPAPLEYETLKLQLEQEKEKNEILQEQNQELKNNLNHEKDKPWWAKLFGVK